MAGLPERVDDCRGCLRNERWRAKEDGGVEVALERDAGTELSAEGGEVHTPIHGEHVGPGLGNGGEKMVGSLGVVDDRRLRVRGVQSRDDLLNRGQDEGFVFGEGELATPGVEELHGRSAGGDLGLQVGNRGLRDALEERTEGRRVGAKKGFYDGERIGAAAFDHVAGEGPGGGGEAENRNVRAKFTDDAANGFGKEPGFALGIKAMEGLDVGFAANRFGKMRTAITKFERQAHRFGRNENVGKNDDRINAEPPEGLQGDFGSEVRRFANFEKGMFGANSAVFGKVTASLAHHPHGNAWEAVTAAGAEE